MSDLFSIEGKTALVTGGSRGIGLMIARGYVEAGARVYISSRKAEVCDEVAAELSKIGTCVSIPANLNNEPECQRLASEIADRESRLDILVNNAGANWGAPYDEFPAAAWDRVLDRRRGRLLGLTLGGHPEFYPESLLAHSAASVASVRMPVGRNVSATRPSFAS